MEKADEQRGGERRWENGERKNGEMVTCRGGREWNMVGGRVLWVEACGAGSV